MIDRKSLQAGEATVTWTPGLGHPPRDHVLFSPSAPPTGADRPRPAVETGVRRYETLNMLLAFFDGPEKCRLTVPDEAGPAGRWSGAGRGNGSL